MRGANSSGVERTKSRSARVGRQRRTSPRLACSRSGGGSGPAASRTLATRRPASRTSRLVVPIVTDAEGAAPSPGKTNAAGDRFIPVRRRAYLWALRREVHAQEQEIAILRVGLGEALRDAGQHRLG